METKFDIKDFNKIKNDFKQKSSKDGYRIIYNRINGINNDQDLNDTKIAFKRGIRFNKEDLCKKYNWDLKKPIVGIFDHSYMMVYLHELVDLYFKQTMNGSTIHLIK